MPAPIIYSTTGAVLSADETAFAQRVAASFSLDMGAGWVKTIRQVDPSTNAIVEYHADKNIAYVTPGGATDYVGLLMPNPVPYRGVSIAVMDMGVGRYSYVEETFTPVPPAGQLVYRSTCTYTVSVSGVDVFSHVGKFEYIWTTTGMGVQFVWTDWPGGGSVVYTGPYGVEGYSYTTYMNTTGNGLTWPSHTDVLAVPDFAKPTTKIATSDGVILASEIQNISGGHTYYVPDTVWDGGESVGMYVDSTVGTPDHQLTFTCPEDCVYPPPAAPVAAFHARRQAWYKKNSDEVIAALKTGFATGSQGVTRAELQTGDMPETWRFLIKRDVDNSYGEYPADEFGILPGAHTHREILYFATAFSDTVTSDTSANLTQAGVKTTAREVALAYDIEVDGAVVTREASFVGTLTQTLIDPTGTGNFERVDTYANWYNDESATMPPGVPDITWSYQLDSAYLRDGTTSRIGAFLNGSVQHGRYADSTYGYPGNGLLTEPFYSSTVTATVPDFIKTWHDEAKITYAKDGVGASITLNDSAMYGVTEIHISPVGLIADGSGHASAGEAVGMFSVEEDGTHVEIYGTAIYGFDWQEGAFTFKRWKPLLDAGGNEVTSRTVDLPAAWSSNPINCIITYKGLHWPDVVTALRLRDNDAKSGTFEYSDPNWWAIVQALK